MGNTLEWLQKLLDDEPCTEVEFRGHCHDCGVDTRIIVTVNPEDGGFIVEGGAIYKIDNLDSPFFKCDNCFGKNRMLTNYNACEVYSRVVGYLRPVKQWNPGKISEFSLRKNFKV